PAAPPGRRKRGRRLVMVLVVACSLVRAAVAAVLVSRSAQRTSSHRSPQVAATISAPPVAAVTSSSELDAAAAWAAQKLPLGAQIVSAPDARTEFLTHGFTAVLAVAAQAPAGGAPLAFEYLVSDPALVAMSAGNAAIASALNA